MGGTSRGARTSRGGSTLSCCTAAWLFLVLGCGSSDAMPPQGTGMPGSDAGSHDAATHDRDAVGDGSGGLDGGPAGDGRSTSFGDIVIVDVPNTACVPTRAQAVPLSNGAATAGGFEKMGPIGDRRFAFGAEGSVVVTFGYDGTSPSAPILGPLAASAQNGALEALVADANGFSLQFYDAQGAPDGAPVTLDASLTSGLSLGAGPTMTLAVGCTATDVVGRLVDQNRAPGPMVSLFNGASGDGACRTSTLWNGMNFSVVWTRRLHDGFTKTSIGYVDLDGTLSFGKVLVLSGGVHELVDFGRAPFGYVVLFDEGEGSGNPVAVRLDDFGNILSPAVRLNGSGHGFSIATYGSNFAVGALLADGRAAMRPFDSTANVLGPWVCVDDRTPDMPFAGRAALGTDDQGYAVVARMSDGSNWYMRTNSLGDDAPARD
jgi:hypothetical protein